MLSKILFSVFVVLFSTAAWAEDVEIARLEVAPTPLPIGFDVLGARTGIDIDEVRSALEAKGYREIGAATGDGLSNIDAKKVEILCENGNCITFRNQRLYLNTYRWEKDSELITVSVTPPPAGSLVYSIDRKIDGGDKNMADFDTLLEAARAKYGDKAQWKSRNGIACWGVSNGQLVEPDKKKLMCDSNIRSGNKRAPDAFFYMQRTDNSLDGRYVLFRLYDRQLAKASYLPLRDVLQNEIRNRRAERERKSNSGSAPEL